MNDKFDIDDMYHDQLCTWMKFFEYSQRQMTTCMAIQQEFLGVYFSSVKDMKAMTVPTLETGTDLVNKLFNSCDNATEKVLEAHTDFYSMVFPWDDGEPETTETIKSPVKSETKEVLVLEEVAEAA